MPRAPHRRPGRAVLMCVAALTAGAAALARPPAEHHPLIGAWTITPTDGSCTETYIVRRNGTTLVTSAEEVSESEVDLSDEPSPKGYYKWVDKVVRDNGGKDCSGHITAPGSETTNYILFHPSGDLFLMCAAEDIGTCFGPFVRVKGSDI